MLQETVDRISDHQSTIVICQETHRFLVEEQLSQIGVNNPNIILEPVGRNTAPAIALAAMHCEMESQDNLLLVMPADHVIVDKEGFMEKVDLASNIAEEGFLVTFGIKPQYPETGYGYIKSGKLINKGCYQVEQFVEKPDKNIAQGYLASGDYFWNSGMFLFKASVFLSELNKHSPEIFNSIKSAYNKIEADRHFLRPGKSEFESCPEDSIDYAVMEETELAAVVPADIGWSDIGSWQSIWQLSNKDQSNNYIQGDVLTEKTCNCLIHAEHRLVTTVGTQNLIIVETADAVLVADKSSVQNVKQLVEQLKLNERQETSLHRRVYRPWGFYEGIDIDDQFQVKRIGVKPGGQLSLQKHAYRAEHWIVVRGIATVTRDDDIFEVRENESTYIPLGAVHRLENKEDTLLELIEIQTGSYFGEDDIVRLEDKYGRHDSE